MMVIVVVIKNPFAIKLGQHYYPYLVVGVMIIIVVVVIVIAAILVVLKHFIKFSLQVESQQLVIQQQQMIIAIQFLCFILFIEC